MSENTISKIRIKDIEYELGTTIDNVSGLQTVLDGFVTEDHVDGKIAAIPTPDVSGQINTHNTNTSAHNDIRNLISGLTTRLNTLANSDDTTLDQMSEIVAYIKSNRSLIDSITTSKVNVADIVNNLTTNVNNKPISAAQGVALKALIDALQAEVDGKSDEGHTHNYAGSSFAGGSANSAVKLDTSAGSATQPVYFSDGKPVATTYTLGASVPSNAKFTDTTYDVATTTTAGLMSAADKVKLDGLNGSGGSSGGTSVQSDMNQNDSTQPDYIKNRTHWAELVTNTETLMTEKTIEGFEEGFIEIAAIWDLIDGDEIAVVWDGVEYSAVASEIHADGMTMIVFGNPILMGIDENAEDNGQPFVVGYIDGYFTAILITSDMESTHHTVGVVKTRTTQKIHQLDSKYINTEWMAQKTIASKEVFSETTATLSPDGVVDPNWSFDLETLTNAEYVDVIWNGETYRCVPKNISGYFLIGNIALFDPTFAVSSEPFLFLYFMSEMVVITPEEVQATFRIIAYNSIPTSTIPMEYLPETLHFGYEHEVEVIKDAITWDGQKNNDVVSPWSNYTYVANAVPTFEECCNGGVIELTDGIDVLSHSFDSTYVISGDLYFAIGSYIIVATEDTKYIGVQPGIYFTKSGNVFVKSFRINNYSFVETVKKIKTIDPKCIPEECFGSGLPEVTTDNNGAFLRVVDGAWATVNLPSVEDGEF